MLFTSHISPLKNTVCTGETLWKRNLCWEDSWWITHIAWLMNDTHIDLLTRLAAVVRGHCQSNSDILLWGPVPDFILSRNLCLILFCQETCAWWKHIAGASSTHLQNMPLQRSSIDCIGMEHCQNTKPHLFMQLSEAGTSVLFWSQSRNSKKPLWFAVIWALTVAHCGKEC